MGFRQHIPGTRANNSVVLDNSVMMRWIFDDGSANDRRYATRVIQTIEEQSTNVLVPYLWLHEAAFVVNFYAISESIEWETCMNQLNSLFDLCTVVITEESPSKIFQFANYYKISSYDSAYLMLADLEKSPIATLDKKMTKVAKMLKLKLF